MMHYFKLVKMSDIFIKPAKRRHENAEGEKAIRVGLKVIKVMCHREILSMEIARA